MPKSNSKMTLSERREKAFEYFSRGYTNRKVASILKVNKDTAAGYRRKYEENLQAQARANPDFLKDIAANTVRSLEELDRIREDAWSHMESRTVKVEHTCPECETEYETKIRYEITDKERVAYQSVLLKAQDQRSKLFGVMGVKQEVFIALVQVKAVQDLILEFISNSLCPADKAALEAFLLTPELQAYMTGTRGLDAANGILDLPSEELAAS